MGFEIIERNNTTPHRLLALLQLVPCFPQASRRQLIEALQPNILLSDREKNREMAEQVYRAVVLTGLVTEIPTKERIVKLSVEPSRIANAESFRLLMQERVLGKVLENEDHFVLNQFAAWYCVQDERVMGYSRSDMEAKFHQAMYPRASTRVLSEDPGINSWRAWAEFLGWGWALKLDGREETRIAPDATLRLRPLLPALLPDIGRELVMGDFMAALAARCPELDGGVLFERCWEASRGGEVRGNRLSLMLSTALRVLHASGEIELSYRSDSAFTWTLFPAQSHIGQVTHVARKEAR